jgi:hypothetical protein
MAASCPMAARSSCFSDYARPAIRLSSLMGAQVIYVMTHDSIGLGEDGPTHQPVEHLAALRAIPNSHRLPPGRRDRGRRVPGSSRSRAGHNPSLLALSRQNLPALRVDSFGREQVRRAVPTDRWPRRRRRDAVRHRLGGRDRGQRQGEDRSGRPHGARRLGPLLRAVLQAGRGLQARRRSATSRSRSRSRLPSARAGMRSSAMTASSSA